MQSKNMYYFLMHYDVSKITHHWPEPGQVYKWGSSTEVRLLMLRLLLQPICAALEHLSRTG
jgi:hypothetical protein